jgi:hypothetical protein
VCALFLVIKTNMMTPLRSEAAPLDALPWKSANATSTKRTQHSAWIGAKQYQKCENVFTCSMHGRVFIHLHIICVAASAGCVLTFWNYNLSSAQPPENTIVERSIISGVCFGNCKYDKRNSSMPQLFLQHTSTKIIFPWFNGSPLEHQSSTLRLSNKMVLAI